MPLCLLLAALAVAPARAAVRPASCLHVSSKGASSSLEALRRCQAKARADAVAAAARKGAPLTQAQLDRLDDDQRAEARKFLAQPQIVAADGTGGPAPSEDSTGKLGGVAAADLSRVDAKSAASIRGLQGRLHAAAGDGKAGITPAMADDIRATLTQAQGGISPDMQDLLNGVQKDGGKLTPETMKKLQGAAKAAKADGLDLNIAPNVEKSLLETDFDKEKPPESPPAGM